MRESDFHSSYSITEIKDISGHTSWRSPSNLAIVKYWGKYGRQLPRNPSISITLSKAVTDTAINFEVSPKRKTLELNFLFEGEENEAFKNRIEKFLYSIVEFLPFIPNSKLDIRSSNSFPHSSGIASSASSMSALALCLCDIERSIGLSSQLDNEEAFFKKSSFISRLGSGSACRSVYADFALWGEIEGDDRSSDYFAIPQPEFHSIFKELKNDILIVSAHEKSVSSSAGHQLMETNHYANQRFDQAYDRVKRLQKILKAGDLDGFGTMLESEAMTLHALMMASDPSYLLMEPNTIRVINEIHAFRRATNIPIYFSLDAGPNVHIISFQKDQEKVKSFLEDMKSLAVNGRIIKDQIGSGAINLDRH